MPAPHDHLYPARDAAKDRVLTAVLLAGAALAGEAQPGTRDVAPRGGEDSSLEPDRILRLIDRLRPALASDRDLTCLLKELPDAFGHGEPLRFLFQNLFPAASRRPLTDRDGRPFLSEREATILLDTAFGRSTAEIAARHNISPRTVTTHLHHVYRRLNVSNWRQAAARAAALGYLEFEPAVMTLHMARLHLRGADPFETFCAQVGELRSPLELGEARSLAGFGLLLLLVCAAAAREVHGERVGPPAPPGVVREVDASGTTLRQFGREHLGQARGIALAPPAGARHGFTPGHLFVIHDNPQSHPLHRAAISEFTRDGEFVRTFLGGPSVATRLIGPVSIAFAPDGRLLVTSGWLTDAILAFDEGGIRARRFADGCFVQVCAGPQDRIYATQDSPIGCLIKVFGLNGDLLDTIGATRDWERYHGIAVRTTGQMIVTFRSHPFWSVREFGADGGGRPSPRVDGLEAGLLAIDEQDRLYVPCRATGDVKVFSPEGNFIRRIDLGGQLVPNHVAVGGGGKVWVCGWEG